MRVIQVVPAITEEASGPSYSVVRLCQSLIAAGEDVTLAVLDWAPLSSTPAFVKAFPLGRGPRRIGRSPKMCRWLVSEIEAEKIDVIHNHGMWQVNSVYPARAIRNCKTKLVVSPRGAFSHWAMSHGSWFKKLFWPLIQRPALEQASCFHATADAEYEDIRRLGFYQPVAVLPNGIDVPKLVLRVPSHLRELLFLGRLHPVKGVDVLLRAWADLMDRFPDWHLSVTGTDAGYGGQSDYLQQMRALAARLNLKRIDFVDAVYGEAKLSAYRNAELFVLPSHSENFGITVAEALAAGTPAIVTKGAPWRALETHGSGWWIDVGLDAMIAGLSEAMAQPSHELARRGMNGREWMIRDFSWRTIGDRMDQTYKWLINGGELPVWVRLD